MKQKMLNILPSVKRLLTKIPRLRDSDERLMATMWFKHIGEDKVKDLTAINLLQKLSDGQLPSYESISRCRRKIQEEIPELRGEKWKERHDAEEAVKAEIKQMEISL
tara:strand:- start:345 stop:665 length:321 start_codon:yes stop_codon:yes gene_type:complete